MFRFMTPWLLALVFGSYSWAAASEKSLDILGGVEVTDSDPDAVSTVALLVRTDQGTRLCTASILASDILVTAAHCVTKTSGGPINPANIFIAFGKSVRSDFTVIRRIVSFLAHPQWAGLGSRGIDQRDIAVVHFHGGLPLGYNPGVLLPSEVNLEQGGVTLLMGFGVDHMNQNGGAGAGILRKVDALIDRPNFGLTEVLIDQRNGKGACHGDSGGPAFVRRRGNLFLWGVTNRADPLTAADCSQGSVYTRITSYSSFINSAALRMRESSLYDRSRL